MTKALVTGGAGFIGSHLCDVLVARGDRVTAIDDLSLGRRSNINHLLGQPGFEFFKQDLLDEKGMKKLGAKRDFEIIWHLAANSDVARSSEDPRVDLKKTFATAWQALDMARCFRIPRFVLASTPAIYGEVTEILSETYGPLLPISHYGAGKLAAEAFTASYSANYGLQAWILRFPNVVGERATHGILYDFIRKLRDNPRRLEVLGDGNQTKPYLYVRDLVAAAIFIQEKMTDKLNYINIGVESRTKVKDIAKWVAEEMGGKAKIRYGKEERGWKGDQSQYAYDLTKLHRLGWRAPRTSDEAVKISIKRLLA